MDVMPTIKVINRLIFMPSPSVVSSVLAIAHPWDFTVLLKGRCVLSPSGEKRETLPAVEDVPQSH